VKSLYKSFERERKKRLLSAFFAFALRSQSPPQAIRGNLVVSFRQKNTDRPNLGSDHHYLMCLKQGKIPKQQSTATAVLRSIEPYDRIHRKKSSLINFSLGSIFLNTAVGASVVEHCHAERSEASRRPSRQTLRCAQGDSAGADDAQ
jgi:hypothetical protein